MHWQGREIAVESDPPQPVISDGESIGDTPVSARVLPGTLKVLVPKMSLQPGVGELALDQMMSPSHSLGGFLRLLRTRPLDAISETIDQSNRMLLGAPLDRFSRVLPGLILGPQHTRAGLERLKARGVTAILNLRAESDDRALGRATDHYLHLSIIDQMPPSLELLQRGVDFITEELANSGVVYVHCNHGLGRGPSVVAAYLVSTGLNAESAWKRIRQVRPFIRPTRQQIDQVTRFEHDRLGD
jgi:dual specificity MAP kinase phosphatase